MQGRISRCGGELARTALYEAAHALLIRGTKWPALRAWGMAVAKRRGMARARVGAQAGGDPAPHVDGRQRVPLGQAGPRAGRCLSQEERSSSPEPGGAASFPWGRWVG